jgi:hypothetical protein
MGRLLKMVGKCIRDDTSRDTEMEPEMETEMENEGKGKATFSITTLDGTVYITIT